MKMQFFAVRLSDGALDAAEERGDETEPAEAKHAAARELRARDRERGRRRAELAGVFAFHDQ
jgi:hypothetical protein